MWEQEKEEVFANKLIVDENNWEIGEWKMVCHEVQLKELRAHVVAYSRIIKVEGQLEGLPILLLIDNEASHNQITKEMMTSLSLSVTKSRELW